MKRLLVLMMCAMLAVPSVGMNVQAVSESTQNAIDGAEKEKEFIPIYHNCEMNAKYRLDFVCLDQIIVECKAVEQLTINHRAQLFNYMRLTKLPMGILVNFSQKSAVIERYFFDTQKNEIMSMDGTVLSRFKK